MSETIDRLRERARTLDPEPIAELAMRMIELWTPPGSERPMAELAAASLREAGVDDVVLDEEFEGSPSVIARIPGRRPGPTIQWHGHMDAIATPQGEPRREGDTIHGRGASDMKGAIAADGRGGQAAPGRGVAGPRLDPDHVARPAREGRQRRRSTG